MAVNKIDTPKVETLVAEFYQLGIEQLYPVSAEHGIGVAELLDAIYLPLLPAPESEQTPSSMPKVAVVGRTNVGKSTLVNAVLGEDRVVVSDVPGTTRDSIDSLATYQGHQYLFTDTAGIRRRGKIDRGIEGYSVARSLRAIGRSDVAVLLLDAEEGVTEQDTKIAGIVLRQGRACFLLVTKWDLREGDQQARQHFEADLRRRFPFLSWAPVLFASAGMDRVAVDAVGVAILKALGSNDAIMKPRVFAQEQIAWSVQLGLGASSAADIAIETPDPASEAYAERIRAILAA